MACERWSSLALEEAKKDLKAPEAVEKLQTQKILFAAGIVAS